MPISDEMRRLQSKWLTGTAWPKRLDWVEIDGLRGWSGQRFEMKFPIMAVVGENGAGKSTVIQAAASVYAGDPGEKDRFASAFFPETTWDQVQGVEIRYSVREGSSSFTHFIRKPTGRWRRNPERKRRHVEYIDLSRIQPVAARIGFSKLANPRLTEIESEPFETKKLGRMSSILGRTYGSAKMVLTSGDTSRRVPVMSQGGSTFSGFHQGAGETTIAELLQADIPKYSLVLIDEIESSLHPRAQRRLMRDLATIARVNELQIIVTTHSPYVLEELPLEARAHILFDSGRKEIIYGVTPEFSMTKMDDLPHHESDVYVEDARAARMLIEILVRSEPSLIHRCQIIPCGASSVGRALGQMVAHNNFPRPTAVFLDGDSDPAAGCFLLPGTDAPERVVFGDLQATGWPNGLATRTGRAYPNIVDACNRAMTLPDHHDWVAAAATELVLGGDDFWQALCAEWVENCLSSADAEFVAQHLTDLLSGITPTVPIQALVQETGPVEQVNQQTPSVIATSSEVLARFPGLEPDA